MTPHGAYDDLIPEVHPDQMEIPEGPYAPGELQGCYWCGDPATYGRLDIGLPKPRGAPKTLVTACAYHFHRTVQPALLRAAREVEEKRVTTHQARRGK